jgi:parvulin-like peptidyl-prolyl isomerase
MTIRVKPVDRGRVSRDPNRRNFYMNIGFGIAVVVSVLILVTVAATSWYGDHLAAVATVDGQSITKDQLGERAIVEAWRLQQLAARIRAEVAAGRLTQAQAEARITQIDNQLKQQRFLPGVLEKIIDTRIQAKLAQEAGITITPEQIDKRILDEKTRREERHAWLIAVKPTVDTGKTDPTDAQKAVARKAVEDALAQIKSGAKPWEDVARAVSTDPSKASGGDVGWLDSGASEDANWQAAIFKLDVNGVTDAIQGTDGTYRIGRVTEIVPAQVDAAWDQKLAEAKVNPAAYRAAVESEVVRTTLEEKIVADESKAGIQRRVQELFIAAPQAAPAEGSVKVRHILYSPKGDPSGASKVPANDPTWTEAQLKAQKAYDAIKADPKKFDEIARKESNETQDLGDDGTGGKFPYFDPTSQLDQAFADQVFKAGLKPGDLLPPFRSSFGWHVVQIMYFPPDSDQMKKLKDQAAGGADFGQLARDFSEGPKGGKGGDIGWVAKGQLDDRLTNAILAAPVGGLSEIVDIPNNGIYLFKVIEEKTAVPDADQLVKIKQIGFSNWYTAKKDAARITRDPSLSGA